MGDLNAQNKFWHCKKDNQYGLHLETIINDKNIKVINNKTPTYTRGKSIIDLTLLSSDLANNPCTFKVLPDIISDHQPTLTTVKGLPTSKGHT